VIWVTERGLGIQHAVCPRAVTYQTDNIPPYFGPCHGDQHGQVHGTGKEPPVRYTTDARRGAVAGQKSIPPSPITAVAVILWHLTACTVAVRTGRASQGARPQGCRLAGIRDSTPENCNPGHSPSDTACNLWNCPVARPVTRRRSWGSSRHGPAPQLI
jgi:hypothetical protein